MGILFRFFCALLASVSLLSGGCAKEEKKPVQLGKTPPVEVVTRFYDLISEGGKITNREALKMVSDHHRAIDPNDFRKWTETYSRDTKIKVVETKIPKEPNKDGVWVAKVKLEVHTPSSFGDSFTTTSKINLILDEEENEWKIDFFADTIDEADYLNAPAEARVKE